MPEHADPPPGPLGAAAGKVRWPPHRPAGRLLPGPICPPSTLRPPARLPGGRWPAGSGARRPRASSLVRLNGEPIASSRRSTGRSRLDIGPLLRLEQRAGNDRRPPSGDGVMPARPEAGSSLVFGLERRAAVDGEPPTTRSWIRSDPTGLPVRTIASTLRHGLRARPDRADSPTRPALLALHRRASGSRASPSGLLSLSERPHALGRPDYRPGALRWPCSSPG